MSKNIDRKTASMECFFNKVASRSTTELKIDSVARTFRNSFLIEQLRTTVLEKHGRRSQK